MRTVDIITAKRDGKALSADEIRHVVEGCAAGIVPDYQVAAWLMAIYFRGMASGELAVLTEAMVQSGEIYDLSSIALPKIDKHSTGGVGDKVSLVLAPLAASAGVAVPMVSGRALGHTGGTLDKLQAIPGFRVNLDAKTLKSQIERIGVAMVGQSDRLVPADRKLYALRDVTGTVESIPLIAASIMSKKIAAGLDGLVMDVKVGNGAFMPQMDDAQQLAQTLVSLGRNMGLPVVALLTDMNQPLGRAVGNAVEVAECIEVLKGRGPDDLRELALALGSEMLVLGKIASSQAEARARLLQRLDEGHALQKFIQMVEAQGGDPRIVEDGSLLGFDDLPEEPILATQTGVVAAFDTRQVGLASMILGAGRQIVYDRIDHAVGLLVERKIGDQVRKGEALCRMLYRDREKMGRARELLGRAIIVDETTVSSLNLVKSRLDGGNLNTPQGGSENGNP